MLPALPGAEREVQDKVCVERVSDATERRQSGLMLPAFEASDRRLRDPAASRQLCLREAFLGPEGDELSGNLLVRLELLERCSVLRILPQLAVNVCQGSSSWHVLATSSLICGRPGTSLRREPPIRSRSLVL